MKHPIRTAVFPVAGLGARFLPATKACPKEMLTVVDKPLIHYAVEEAKKSGIENFVFVTSQGKTAIEDHFDHNAPLERILTERGKVTELNQLKSLELSPGQAIFVRQQAPLGLGHAVWCARHLVGHNPFALILADDLVLSEQPCLQQMIDCYQEVKGNVVAVMDVEKDHVSRYGILDIQHDDGIRVQAKGVIEKPAPETAPSQTAIIGRYILHPDIFNILETQKVGIGGEVQLTDAFTPLIKKMPFHGLRFSGQRFDCGTKEGWLEANIAFAYARNDLKHKLIDAIKRHCKTSL
jgi:UTP--glucose-1-phosphate uridylyltransferase